MLEDVVSNTSSTVKVVGYQRLKDRSQSQNRGLELMRQASCKLK